MTFFFNVKDELFGYSGQSLSYYDGAKKKGEISLAGCKVHMLNPSDADGKPFPFEVEIPSEK